MALQIDSLELTTQLFSLAYSRSRSGASYALAGGELGAPQGGEGGLADTIKVSELQKINLTLKI